jgi:protein-tyrosine phosphatase
MGHFYREHRTEITLMTPGAHPANPAHLQRPWGWALLWGAILAVIFFGTYNSTNYYTASLEPVPSLYFFWEPFIPFWPWSIVPYWSIDIFYGAALFLARHKAELFALVKRLLLAQALCVSGFLVFPLKFAFVRPATDGLFGQLFTALSQFDLPYNQAPSLHIVLLLILWRQYLRYFPGRIWGYLINAWSFLIGVSVLTTWQHHAIDVISGLWVGALCLLVFPEQAVRWRAPSALERPQRTAVAGRYLAAAAVFTLPGLWLWPGFWAAFLLWIAAALAYVALVYWRGSWAHLGKNPQGPRLWTHYLLLAPYYWGAQLSARWFLRGQARYQAIVPGIYLGSVTGAAAFFKEQGFGARLLDMTAEFPAIKSTRNAQCFPHLDLVPLGRTQLTALAAVVEQAHKPGPLLIACALGVARSSAVLAAWLILYRHCTPADAEEQLRRLRPCVRFSKTQRDELVALENPHAE